MASDQDFEAVVHRVLSLEERMRVVEGKVATLGGVVVGEGGPVIDHVDPASVVVGAASFTLRVIGTGFTAGSVIWFNGGAEPTTYVSPTEVTTGVDMSTAGVAVEVGVEVRDGAKVSNAVGFTFVAAEGAGGEAASAASASASADAWVDAEAAKQQAALRGGGGRGRR